MLYVRRKLRRDCGKDRKFASKWRETEKDLRFEKRTGVSDWESSATKSGERSSVKEWVQIFRVWRVGARERRKGSSVREEPTSAWVVGLSSNLRSRANVDRFSNAVL